MEPQDADMHFFHDLFFNNDDVGLDQELDQEGWPAEEEVDAQAVATGQHRSSSAGGKTGLKR